MLESLYTLPSKCSVPGKENKALSIEEWSQEWAIIMRGEPPEWASEANMFRKACLSLLYEMVDEWAKSGFSPVFERAILQTFKQRRMERILGICLPMDRSQCLLKMRNPSSRHDGIPWFSALHLNPNGIFADKYPNEHIKWVNFSYRYEGSPSMSKKLFRILYSKEFGFQKIKKFKRWSRPCKPIRDDGSSGSMTLIQSGLHADYKTAENYGEILHKLSRLEGLVHNGFQGSQQALAEQQAILNAINGGVNRLLRALAVMTVADVKKCPNLIWLVPAPDEQPKSIKAWVTNKMKQKFHLYFVCQHSYRNMKAGENPCIGEPLRIIVNRKRLTQAAPALRLSLMLLRSVATVCGLPFPMPNVAQNAILELGLEFCNGLIVDDSTGKTLSRCDLEMQEMKQSDNGQLDMSTTAQIARLVGPSYDLIAKKAHEAKNSFWKDLIYPVIDASGSTIWVKKEIAESAEYSTKRICFPKPGIEVDEEFEQLSDKEDDDAPQKLGRPQIIIIF